MTKKLSIATSRIIKKCFSKAALENAARELGAPVAPGNDIFKSLIAAGRAVDFDHAVEIVAAHLDEDSGDSEARAEVEDHGLPLRET